MSNNIRWAIVGRFVVTTIENLDAYVSSYLNIEACDLQNEKRIWLDG